MRFSILERVLLGSLLAARAKNTDFLRLRALRELREAVSDSLAKDAEAVNLRQDDEGIKWDGQADDEIEITETARSIIAERLRALNAAEKLQEEHFSLCERFLVES